MTEDIILRDLVLGFVRVHILHHAGQGPVYGVALMCAHQRHGYTLSPGALYPLLHGLERAKYLSRCEQVVEGKIRKYYRLTERGRWQRNRRLIRSGQQVEQVEVALTLGAIARMFPAEAWQQLENAIGGAVFAGRASEAQTNLAREEHEGASGGADQFNLDAKIHSAAQGHPVPYLDVHATIERNGQPVLSAVPLVPVARPQRGVAGFHYGNNVRLEPSGAYAVTIQIAPSPFVGLTTLTEAHFRVTFG